MEKIVVIHQPDFMPYLGFFHRLLTADLYVILDNVQFTRNSKDCWHNRDKIKTSNGEKWIKVSVENAKLGTNINEIKLNDNVEWRKNHINLIIENYRKAPFLEEVFPYIQQLYDYDCESLVDFNLKSIQMLMDLFDIKIEMILASSLGTVGKSNELVVDILKKVEGRKYLSGIGARAYYENKPYEDANIEVIWQDFKHPNYQQLWGDFIPFLSSIDLLFNCGIENSRKILRGI